MKKFIGISALTFAFGLMSFTNVATKNVALKSELATAKITWKTEIIDLGNIPQGTPKSMEFEFKNTGSTSVLITSVQGSCGCTATNYTKTKIEKNQSATVSATFNAAAKGAFSKTVTVTTSASETPTVLFFKGTVI